MRRILDSFESHHHPLASETPSQSTGHIRAPLVPSGPADEGSTRRCSVSCIQPALKECLWQLMDVIKELGELLTESTEKLLRLRQALNRQSDFITSTMRKGGWEAKHTPFCMPCMVVAGMPRCGKSTMMDFVLRCSKEAVPRDMPALKGHNQSVNAAHVTSFPCPSLSLHECSTRQRSNSCSVANESDTHYASQTRCKITTGIISTCSVYSRFDGSSTVNSSLHNTKDQDDECHKKQVPSLPMLSLPEKGIQKPDRPDEEAKGRVLLCGSSFPHLSALKTSLLKGNGTFPYPFLDTPVPASTVRCGSSDTIVSECNIALSGCSTRSQRENHHVRCGHGHSSSLFVSLCSSDKGCVPSCHSSRCSTTRVVPWLLKEVSGNVVSSEREPMTTYQLPDMLLGDMFLYVVPCDVVGTKHMFGAVVNLFKPFHNDEEENVFSPKSSGSSIHNADTMFHPGSPSQSQSFESGAGFCRLVDAQRIRQLIADMTYFVITFYDSVLMREVGGVINDPILLDRAPPMVSNVPELIALFQANMKDVFGVTIAPWQVIPFSGSMSHVVHDVFLSASNKHAMNSEGDAVEKKMSTPVESSINSVNIPQFSTTGSMTAVPRKFSVAAQEHGSQEQVDNARAAVERYCQIVFGKNFMQRAQSLEPEHLEQIVLDDALDSAWEKSGADLLLRAAWVFERNAEVFTFSRFAVSIVLWCEQLREVMKKSQKNSRRRARSKYPQLEKLKKVDGIVADALNCLKGLPTPHAMIQKFESVVQEKFERVTGNFWRMILLLLEQAREDATDDPLKKLKTAHRRRHSLPLISSSSSLLHMRLLREFVKLFKLFVGNNYRSQIQQLKSIMQEKAEAAAVRDSSLITVQTIGGKVRMDPSGREPIKGNDREFVGVGIARPKTEVKSGLEHHIPYVDENATALKSVMEHELTLHLSRFNTEIINCLMQDLSAGIPEMAQACDEQRLQVKSTVLRPFSLVEQNACFDPAKMEALRWKLGKFMNCSVVGMRPVKCLESFVTGLRTTIVEDQILLMLASEGALARESAECGSRTVSYLKKSDRKVCAMQMRGLPENTGHFNGRAAHSERPHNEPLYTLMQASELKSSEVGWLEKLQDGAPGAVAAACKVISTGTSSSGRHTAVWKDESNTGSQRCGDKARVSEKVEAGDKGGNEVQPNPLWFVVAVWQRVLSNMTFRTWIELQSTRQAVALNDIKTSFASRGENLRSKLSREISDLEEFLRVEVDEKSRAERKALRTLRRLSSSATAVANDLTRLRESIATEMDLMREREESPFDASRVA